MTLAYKEIEYFMLETVQQSFAYSLRILNSVVYSLVDWHVHLNLIITVQLTLIVNSSNSCTYSCTYSCT